MTHSGRVRVESHAKLIWYIERHLSKPLTLQQVANAHDVSACHVTRLFAIHCNVPLMTYVRQRRLSEAAIAIANGNDILDAALGAGYSSHEAFGRALRKQFGKTPREMRHVPVNQLNLTVPLSMNSANVNPLPRLALQTPRIETQARMMIAGLSASYSLNNLSGIPPQWKAFRPYLGHISGRQPGVTFGVSYKFRPDGIEYLAGVEVADAHDLPPEFVTVSLPAGRYAVFEHRGHVSAISHTWNAIFDSWLANAGLKVRHDPSFERKDERFDGNSGSGLIEIWVPID